MAQVLQVSRIRVQSGLRNFFVCGGFFVESCCLLSQSGRSTCRCGRWQSGQDFLDNSAMHIRQAEVATLKSVGQSFVVDAEQVQHGGM